MVERDEDSARALPVEAICVRQRTPIPSVPVAASRRPRHMRSSIGWAPGSAVTSGRNGQVVETISAEFAVTESTAAW
jgi:hypothetical protein